MLPRPRTIRRGIAGSAALESAEIFLAILSRRPPIDLAPSGRLGALVVESLTAKICLSAHSSCVSASLASSTDFYQHLRRVLAQRKVWRPLVLVGDCNLDFGNVAGQLV